MKRTWVYDPHSGGVKIPEPVKVSTRNRILEYAKKHYTGKFIRIEVRFRSQLCYIDAFTEPYVPSDFDTSLFGESRENRIQHLRNVPTHLCRMRYFGDENSWSMAYYSYSKEKYDPSIFNNGSFHGTPEEAFESSAMYLQG